MAAKDFALEDELAVIASKASTFIISSQLSVNSSFIRPILPLPCKYGLTPSLPWLDLFGCAVAKITQHDIATLADLGCQGGACCAWRARSSSMTLNRLMITSDIT